MFEQSELKVLYSRNLAWVKSLQHRQTVQGSSGLAPFNLVLDKVDLSGINFKGAILTNASLGNSKFYNFGQEKRFGTFDDVIADLNGADLKETNLTVLTSLMCP